MIFPGIVLDGSTINIKMEVYYQYLMFLKNLEGEEVYIDVYKIDSVPNKSRIEKYYYKQALPFLAEKYSKYTGYDYSSPEIDMILRREFLSKELPHPLTGEIIHIPTPKRTFKESDWVIYLANVNMQCFEICGEMLPLSSYYGIEYKKQNE